MNISKKSPDTYGHVSGDKVLVALSQVLIDTCRETDTVARYGGEEFIILMPETNLNGAMTVAEKIRSAVKELRVDCSEHGCIQVSASFEVTSLQAAELDNDEIIKTLLHQADKALYTAKDSGRNMIIAFETE